MAEKVTREDQGSERMVTALLQLGIVESKSDARRLIAQGAVRWEGTSLLVGPRKRYERAHLLLDRNEPD